MSSQRLRLNGLVSDALSLRVDTGPLRAGRVQFCGWSLTRIEMNALGERDLIERAYR